MLKKVITAVALVSSVSSFAATESAQASLGRCIERVRENCGSTQAFLTSWALEAKDQCKIVDARGQSADKVVFFDSNSILSVSTDTCRDVYKEIRGHLVDSVVLNGRLFFAHSSDKVLVVTRTNTIVEMLNSEKESYSSVTEVKAKDDMLILKRDHGVTKLNDEQIEHRLNTHGYYRLLAE